MHQKCFEDRLVYFIFFKIVFHDWVFAFDRLTGWIVAKPSLKLGLTGKKAAYLLVDESWGELEVSAFFTADQDSCFVSAFFLTAHLEIMSMIFFLEHFNTI